MNIKYAVTHWRDSAVYLLSFLKFLDDETYIKIKYKLIFGRKINLNNPTTFCEKLQWLKLHDRKPEYCKLVDKYDVRSYIAEMIGEEYLIPLIGVWEKVDDIDFDGLPDQFVLKCTHDSGSVVICKDKSKFDKKAAVKKLKRKSNRNLYWWGREWPYKDLKPRIVAEQYLKDDECETTKELRDYKFFCFNGNPEYCQVISNRFTRQSVNFFNMNWEHQEFTGFALPPKPVSDIEISKPQNFDKMVWAAAKLSQSHSFLRVDFYEANGRMYFGELTFYPASGFGQFYPLEWNEKIGSMIKLDL